jgi:3-hydroxyacyl-[acyl-carrier-protein] dehydratase
MTNTFCDQTAIKKIIPHRDPFLFVDSVLSFHSGKTLVAERFLFADEYFFKGHFPDKPIMPGVLVTEALAQASGLLLGLTLQEMQASIAPRHQNLYLASADMKFLSPAEPGETLCLKSTLKKQFGNLTLFTVSATVKDRPVAKGTLALGMARAQT